MSTNTNLYAWASDDAEITWLEKEQAGRTTVEDIQDALDEYQRLWKAGIASKAETLTLARAFPDAPEYTEAALELEATEPLVVGGPASVELIDREGHMITTDALGRAFKRYMANFRTRNAMVLHSDVQVGWALPAYISKNGSIFKSGVDTKGLYFICEIRDDTKIAQRVIDQINEGKLKSYSIAGSATKTQNMQKGLMPYMQVDEMELAEVTVCEKGVNQGAGFDLLKSLATPIGSCIDGSCLVKLEKRDGQISPDEAGLRHATEPELEAGIKCESCQYFIRNAVDGTGQCEIVLGDIHSEDWCKLYNPNMSSEGGDPIGTGSRQPTVLEIVLMENKNGNIDFVKSFSKWQELQKSGDCSCNVIGHGTMTVFTDILAKSREGNLRDFLKAEADPFKNGKSFNTLHNYAARDENHHQLLREYGFPSEQPPEGMRYTPVVEIETNDWGIPINPKPPWTVNEAGQELGDRLDEDSPDFHESAKAEARRRADASGHPWFEIPLLAKAESATGKFLNFLAKQEDNPFAIATAQAQKQGYTKFHEGSAGDGKRKEIAESIKR